MEQIPRWVGRSSVGVPRVVQWFAILVSTGLSGLLLLGLGLVTSEYRPSGASLLQQAIVAFAAASLSMCLSVYLLARPLRSAARLRIVYISLFVAIGSALAVYLRESWVWDLPAQLLALVAVLSSITSGSVVVNSVRGHDV